MKTETMTMERTGSIGITRANECLAKPGDFAPPRMLFDAFWREGELAIMFGARGTAKSVLAMELAESLARGRPIEGFRMPEYRRRVLYVDLVMSKEQFQTRYSTEGPGMARTYRFSDALYRSRPDEGEDLLEWLEEAVSEKAIKAVIIDDLSALKSTLTGAKEPLRIMRELKRLKERMGISILILASAAEPAKGRPAEEADLRRMQPLAETADSVFAIGHNPRDRAWRYLVQTRSLSGAIVWTAGNAPMAKVEKEAGGFLKMAFDGRFRMGLDEATLKLICRIKELRQKKLSYRRIGLMLNISYSQAQRLDKKWTQEMADKEGEKWKRGEEETTGGRTIVGNGHAEVRDSENIRLPRKAEGGNDEFTGGDCFECIAGNAAECLDKTGNEETRYENGEIREEGEMDGREEGQIPQSQSSTINYSAIPFAAGLRRRNIYDLKRTVDEYGKEIFIEKEGRDENNPHIWYRIDNRGYIHRWIWRTGRILGPAPYIEIGGWDEKTRSWRIFVPD
jgi:KaiC/GvpD/RAD55 family RecA-like ATPase